MDFALKGKRALVTGAGRGIGRAISEALAAEGVKVAVFSRTQADIDILLNEIGGPQAGHYGHAYDFAPDGCIEPLIEELDEHFGEVDIVINNVGGTLNVTDPLCPIEDWRRVMRLNLEVAIEINRLLVPRMAERGWGRAIQVASTASVENNGPITYCAAKAALAAYTRGFGRIMAASGVVVSAVLPGAVKTEGGHWDIASRERPEHVEKYLAERCPAGRFGTSEEIAALVVFMCSEQASFMQGSTVAVDGGQIRGFHY